MRQTAEGFIQKARAVWGEEYDYSKTVYCGPNRMVTIICRRHGEFEQYPYNHLSGHRCFQCKVDRQRMTTVEFVARARVLFPDYDYSQVEYKLASIKVKICCPVHGLFQRRPSEVLGGRGCPKCCRKPRPKRGPQFKWRPEEIVAMREVFLERRLAAIVRVE